MKKSLKIIFSSFTLLALISCVNTLNSSSSNTIDTSSSADTSSGESSQEDTNSLSSSEHQDVYYTVTFLNYNDDLLDEVQVLEGEEAHYSGTTPTKEEDDEFTYEFDGWDKDLKNIHSDVTTKAKYKNVSKENWGPIHWF